MSRSPLAVARPLAAGVVVVLLTLAVLLMAAVSLGLTTSGAGIQAHKPILFGTGRVTASKPILFVTTAKPILFVATGKPILF